MKAPREVVDNILEFSLQKMLQAEEEICKQLRLLSESANSLKLKNIFSEHVAETEVQIRRLKSSLEVLESRPVEDSLLEKGKKVVQSIARSLSFKSETMEGLIEDSKDMFKKFGDTLLRDLVLACGAEAIEMGEIAAYKNMIFLAEIVGYPDVLDLLKQSLQEEQKAYDVLSAFSSIESKKIEKVV